MALPDLERGEFSSDYSVYEPADLEPSEASRRRKPAHARFHTGKSHDEHPWLLHTGGATGEGFAANIDRTPSHSLRLKIPGFGNRRGEVTLMQMEENKYVEYYSKSPDEDGQHTRYKRMQNYGTDCDDEPKPSCMENLVGCASTCVRSFSRKTVPTVDDDEDAEEGSTRFSCAKACGSLCASLVNCGCCDSFPKLTASLKRIRWQGIKMFFKGMKDVYRDTVIGSTVSDAEVYIQFLLTVVGLVLQVLSLEKQQSTIIGIASVVLAAVLVVFGILNLIVHIYAWRLSTFFKWRKFMRENKETIRHPKLWWKKWKEFCKESRKNVVLRAQRANEQDSDEEEGDDEELLSFEPDDHFIENRLGSAGERSKTVARVLDLVRVMFGEMLYYPRMILAIFQVIQAIYHLQQKENTVDIVIDVYQNHTTQYIALGVTMFQMLINVYFSRVFFLLALLYSIQNKRRKKKNLGTFGVKGSGILALFCLFLIGQMLMQVMIVTHIAGVYTNEFETYLQLYSSNSGSLDVGAEDQLIEVSISWSLWYMILFGYIIIWLSSFAFLALHYYSLQKFLIRMVVDVWKKKDLNKILGIVKKSRKNGQLKIEEETKLSEQSEAKEEDNEDEQLKTEEDIKDEQPKTMDEDKEDGQSVAEENIQAYEKSINWTATILSPFSIPASILFVATLVYYFICTTSGLLQIDASQFVQMVNIFLQDPLSVNFINPSDNCSLVIPPTTENSTCIRTYSWFVYLWFTGLISEIINSHFVFVVVTISFLPYPLLSFAVCHPLFVLGKLCREVLSQLSHHLHLNLACQGIHLPSPCQGIHLPSPCQGTQLDSLCRRCLYPENRACRNLIVFVLTVLGLLLMAGMAAALIVPPILSNKKS